MIENVLDRDILSFEIEKSCIDEKKVIGSFQKNTATIELLNPNNKYSNLKGTYISTYKGTFYVDDISPVQEEIKIKLSCFDLTQKFETSYDNSKFLFPMSLKSWKNAICNELSIDYDDSDFPNSDYILNSEPYIKKGATYKDVIKMIAQASSCWAIIDYDDKLYFNWFNNELVEVKDWFDLTTEDESTKQVNMVVLGRGDVEDNVIYPETEPDDVKEIRIDSNDILDLDRKGMIVPIYNQVNGFKCIVFNMKTVGFLNAKVGNKISYPDLYRNQKESYIMHHVLTFLGGDYTDERNYTSQFEAVELDETNTNYVYSESIEERIDKTEITTNKLDGEIKAVTQKTTEISDDLNNNYYTKTNIDELVQTSETGITNTFSEAGGNNIFRNTSLFAKETKQSEIKETKNVYSNASFIEIWPNWTSQSNLLSDILPSYNHVTTYGRQDESNGTFTPIKQNATYQIIVPNLSFLTDGWSTYTSYLLELDANNNIQKDSNGKIIKHLLEEGTFDISFESTTKKVFIYAECAGTEGGSISTYAIDVDPIDTDALTSGFSHLQLLETSIVQERIEGYEYWDGDVIRSSNENASSRASMLLQNGTLSQEQEVPNGNYSISFYYKKLIELANASVIINDIEYELDSLDVKQFYTGEQDSETKEYITQPINVTNGHIKIVFKCDTNNGVEIYDLMCNKGSVKLAYSQNQNETTTDTVNISKGITITSSVDDIKFKADYDGIRTLDNNGNIKTKFTDKGMETNEAKITEKAEITSLLFQEVDDQSWITKI